LSLVAGLYLMIQVVCIGTLPGLSASERPIVDAAQTFLGPRGATLIGIGALLSMLGTLNVTMLTVSRVPYALALAGHLPRVLTKVHPRHRTPYVAVVLSGILVLALTLSSSFVYLLTVSTISRLLVFAVTCLSLPKLRRMDAVPAALFVVPGGIVIPAAAVMLIAWLVVSSSWVESRDVTISLLVGVVVYAAGHWREGTKPS
jgi:amino acid transporter